MNRQLFAVATIAALASAATWSAEPSGSTSAGFGISVVVTDKGSAIFGAWDRPTGKQFDVSSIKIAPRGKLLSALVLFSGCKPDDAGNCNTDLDIVAYDPQGKIYGEMLGVELWRQKTAPEPGFTQLSRSYMGIVIEPRDPYGTYKVVARARDRNAKTEATAETQFQVGM